MENKMLQVVYVGRKAFLIGSVGGKIVEEELTVGHRDLVLALETAHRVEMQELLRGFVLT
jgi:hypothetical protein